MDELIDIYDASLRPLGTMERIRAHQTAQWHRTFHCWLVSTPSRAVIVQLRSLSNRTHPGKLDISAAGHLAAGESVLEGVREVLEELGVSIDLSDLLSAGDRVEVSDAQSGVKNREYQSVFFWPTEKGLLDFAPDPKEVGGLALLPIAAGLDLFAGRVKELTVETADVGADGQLFPGIRAISLEHFIPRIQRYYMAALIMAERICDGKTDLAIS